MRPTNFVQSTMAYMPEVNFTRICKKKLLV